MPVDLAEVRAALNVILQGRHLALGTRRRVLTEVRDAMPAVIGRQHPLGFLVLDLSQLTGIVGARLHIWKHPFVERADPLGRLHDHSWTLHSNVLAGALVDEVLAVQESEHGEYVGHQVVYGEPVNKLRPLDQKQFSLDVVQRREVLAGSTYTLAPQLVHRTNIRRLPTATLVVAVPGAGPGPIVYSPSGSAVAPGGAASRREAAPGAAVIAAFDDVLSSLTAE